MNVSELTLYIILGKDPCASGKISFLPLSIPLYTAHTPLKTSQQHSSSEDSS
jgi:hypothetical protein